MSVEECLMFSVPPPEQFVYNSKFALILMFLHIFTVIKIAKAIFDYLTRLIHKLQLLPFTNYYNENYQCCISLN